MPKLLILTGSPISQSLQYSPSHLTAPLLPSFLPFSRENNFSPSKSISSHRPPQWRSLPFSRQHIPTGLTQATNPNFLQFEQYDDPVPGTREGEGGEETSFLSTTDLSFVSGTPVSGIDDYHSANEKGDDDDEETILSQYYEHSFAVHEDIPSSAVAAASFPTSTSNITSDSPSSLTNDTTIYDSFAVVDDNIENNTLPQPQTRLLTTSITDLRTIPSSSYLHSIDPQTMTVNLLIGLISLPPPRTIITRKDHRAVVLVEMIVGDETRAGFGVNLWLPNSDAPGKGKDTMRSATEGLRPRDVLLMTNIALTSFRGRVYGQSLRRGVTGVELVYRFPLEGEEGMGVLGEREVMGGEGGEGVMLEKVRRVRGWVLGFVGGGGMRRDEKEGKGGGGGGGVLPDDTQ
ncbi:MAG: hypothetical protein Q9220_004759 [cf. Caloplaca sp. 1 TL-2023]